MIQTGDCACRSFSARKTLKMNAIDAARRTRTKLKVRQMLLLIALDESRKLHQAAALANRSQPAATQSER
jgi:hypothetical protein